MGLVLAGLLALSVAAAAEDEPTELGFGERVEIEIESRRDAFEVVPVGEQGVVLVGSEDKGREWSFSRYDTSFQPVWSVDHDFGDKSWLREKVATESTLWLLVDARGDSYLFGVDLGTGEVSELRLNLPGNVKRTTHLVVKGQDAYVVGVQKYGGLLKGGRGSLLHVDTTSGRGTRLPVAEVSGDKKLWLQGITPSAEGADLVGLTIQKRQVTLSLLEAKGATVEQVLRLVPDDEHNLLSAQRVASGERDLVFGTYARSAKAVTAQGMYMAAYRDGEELFREHHSFTSFDHFFDHLREGRQDRLEKKIERKEEQGKDLKLNYLLNVHDVQEWGGNYVAVAEAFYPEYQTHTRTVTTTDANGNVQTRVETYQVFVGYRYTHAVVAAFDQQGKLVWDASVPIKNILSTTIRDRVKVRVEGERAELVYAYGGRLYTRVFDGTGLVEDKTKLQAEDTKRGWASDAEYWHGDRFVMWGFEKVKSEGEGKRWVFAFSSVSPNEDP